MTNVALAETSIARPAFAPSVEIVSAAAAPRRFPARVSDTLGVCVKTGPSHVVVADGRQRVFAAGAVCVRPPGCVWAATTEHNGFLSIDVPASFLDEAPRPGMRFEPSSRVVDPIAAARSLLSAASPLEAEQVLVDLLAGLGADPVGEAVRPTAVGAARELVAASPGARLSLGELAAHVGVTKFALVRGFRRHVGITPHAYVVLRRLELSRELLAQGATPSDAALAAGFADQAHLTRWFRRVHGITPGVYTRQLRRKVNIVQDGGVLG